MFGRGRLSGRGDCLVGRQMSGWGRQSGHGRTSGCVDTLVRGDCLDVVTDC